MKVVKIGGSLKDYVNAIIPIFKEYEVLLIPGGGLFADAVRAVYRNHNISDQAAHDMAILAMHQYGIFLSDISGIPTTSTLEGIHETTILLPRAITAFSGLKSTWDVTSDTIAGYITKSIGELDFIKLTDVDGIKVNGRIVKSISAGKLLNTNTCLDKSLPSYLQTWKMDCRVVNGKIENNIRRALDGEPIGTLVTGGK
jgi:aspartokinase-like uncharacterized kinase